MIERGFELKDMCDPELKMGDVELNGMYLTDEPGTYIEISDPCECDPDEGYDWCTSITTWHLLYCPDIDKDYRLKLVEHECAIKENIYESTTMGELYQFIKDEFDLTIGRELTLSEEILLGTVEKV